MPLLDLELYRKDVVVSDQPLVRLSVIDAGRSPAERTLLFIHGFGGFAMQWEHQLIAFADKHRVVAPDLRGHGLSDCPPNGYAIDDLVRDIERVVDALHFPPTFVLLGHSFGGALATTYAMRHPDRVERLVLVSTAVDFVLNPVLRLAFHLPLVIAEPIRALVPRALAAPAFVLKAMYHRALTQWRGRDYFPRLPMPTLVIIGHRDLVFKQSAYDAVPDLIPGAQLAKIPVSAHLVQLERPDAVNRAITRFLGAATVSWRAERERDKAALLQQRPWLRHYEADVPYTLAYPSQPLFRFLDSAARRHPNTRALVFYDGVLTYRELNAAVNRLANALMQLGVKKGDRVALLLPNSPQMVIAYYAALKIGAVVVSLNPLFTADELGHQLNDSGAETIIALSVFYPLVRMVRAGTPLKRVIVTNIKEYFSPLRRLLFTIVREAREGHRIDVRGERDTYVWQDLLTRASADTPNVEVTPDDLAVIQYSTGTTDIPKGVMLTHANLVANTTQVRHWLTDIEEGNERIVAVLPFSHSYGMTAAMNVGIAIAATLILLPSFSTREVLNVIKKYRPTMFPGVPTMYVAINQYPGVRRFGLQSIRACVSGAAPLPIEVQEAFEKITRGKLVEGYGLTEASPVTHVNPIYGQRKIGSIGIPLPDTDAKIVDIHTGQDVPVGNIGELVVRGPQVMRGYWNRPDETAQVLRDGWLFTGDLARMDEDGYFQIIDRKKDMILAGTYNIYPRDVEEVLYENPKVLEVAVTGVPPDGKEQIVKAYVVLRKGEMATPEEFIEFCRQRLADYAVPHLIEFRDQLPKTFVGKVFKRKLTEDERVVLQK
ncbi:MAG: alpha/beta fold hydrolase [Anaerolineae bacterium]|nr:alpha/beta fold hydrolase [Anaerolineae bacterium]